MSDVRTTFGPGGMRRSALVRGLGLAAVALVAAVAFALADNPGIALALGFVAVVLGGVTLYAARTSLRSRTVVIDDAGVTISGPGSGELRLPWSETAAWSIGQVVGGKVVRGSSRSLLIWPKEPSAGAETGPFRSLWVASIGAWRACQVLYVDGSEEELDGAMRRHAPNKARAVES